ncbi:MAG TPA: hypothetical protein VFG81_02155 [Anaerolineales bacterium]|nr:hypothetical protein [Anaerolineales bacterium]
MNKTQRLIQIWLPILIVLGMTKLFSVAADIPLRQFMLDPTEFMHAPFYTGILANLGILLWAATASICLFTALFLPQLVGKAWRDFFLVSGLLTLLLLFDDLLRIHDEILPVYLGIKGDILGIGYVFLITLYLLRYRTLIIQYPYTFLILALGLFGLSVALDVAPVALKHRFAVADLLLFEDSPKLLGIANWLAYFAHLSASVVTKGKLTAPEARVDDWAPATTSDRASNTV